MFQLDNFIGVMCHSTEGKLTRGLKNDRKNLVKFHASSRKSENLHLMGSICPKHTKFSIKEYRRVMSHDNEE